MNRRDLMFGAAAAVIAPTLPPMSPIDQFINLYNYRLADPHAPTGIIFACRANYRGRAS